MKIIMKIVNIPLSIFFIISISCSDKAINKNSEDPSKYLNYLYGKWEVEKVIHLDPFQIVSNDNIDACWKQEVIFTKNSIQSKSVCFQKDFCDDIKYNVIKEKTLTFFDNDSLFVSELGLLQDSLIIVETNCETPFSFIYIINEKQILIGKDNYHFFFVKK